MNSTDWFFCRIPGEFLAAKVRREDFCWQTFCLFFSQCISSFFPMGYFWNFVINNTVLRGKMGSVTQWGMNIVLLGNEWEMHLVFIEGMQFSWIIFIIFLVLIEEMKPELERSQYSRRKFDIVQEIDWRLWNENLFNSRK